MPKNISSDYLKISYFILWTEVLQANQTKYHEIHWYGGKRGKQDTAFSN